MKLRSPVTKIHDRHFLLKVLTACTQSPNLGVSPGKALLGVDSGHTRSPRPCASSTNFTLVKSLRKREISEIVAALWLND